MTSFPARDPFYTDYAGLYDAHQRGVRGDGPPVPHGERERDAGPRERAALAYARHITATPLKFPPEVIAEVRRHFAEREIVILAATAAQVNYWTRLIQALGVPPAG